MVDSANGMNRPMLSFFQEARDRERENEEAKALREIQVDAVTQALRDLCIEANTRLPEEHLRALRRH